MLRVACVIAALSPCESLATTCWYDVENVPAPCAAIGYTFPGVEEGSYCLDEFCVGAPERRQR